jgi:hypothetical protein
VPGTLRLERSRSQPGAPHEDGATEDVCVE